MKNITFLLLLPIFFSCGDSKTSKNDTNDKKTKNAELSKNDAGDENKNGPELFVYDGEYFNALKCEEIDGIKMRWINPMDLPEDTVCIVKECSPDGMVKSWAHVADNQFDGEKYIYREGGTLNTVILYKAGKQVNTKQYREDGTMYSQQENKNGLIDYTQMTYGLKGELRKTEVIENRNVVSCEGLDCP